MNSTTFLLFWFQKPYFILCNENSMPTHIHFSFINPFPHHSKHKAQNQTITYKQINSKTQNSFIQSNKTNPFLLTSLPRRLLNAVESTSGSQFAENDTGHPEELVHSTRAAGEDAAVSDAREGAVSGQLGELQLHLFPSLGGESRIPQERLEQLVLKLVLGCQFAALVIMDVAILPSGLHKPA